MKTFEQRLRILENRVSTKRNIKENSNKEELELLLKELTSLKVKRQIVINSFGLGLTYRTLLNKIQDLLED